MYRMNKYLNEESLTVNESYEGETIEEKIERIVSNNEPITDGAPLIYTDRKDGVQAQYDVRTDRFELAVDAMDKVAQSHLAKRQENINLRVVRDEPKTDIGGPEPTPATGS